MVKQASTAQAAGAHQAAAYDIPLEMREFADKSVEQARKAFDGFVGAAQRTVAAMDDHGGTVRADVQDIGRKTIAFAESNVAASFAFAQQLVRATDMGEVMRLQAEFVRNQMKAMQAQARELGATMTPNGRAR